MSNIRFLDNVLVTSPVAAADAVGGSFPRVVFAGETKTVAANTNSYAFELFNLGTINIRAGQAVEVGDETIFSHGVLRIEDFFTNQGVINIGGILKVGSAV